MSHYDTLGVSIDAEPEVIKAAYRALCKKYHPDITTFPKKEAEERMKAINLAYEVLGNPDSRRQYDSTMGRDNDFDSTFDRSETFENETEEAWAFARKYFPNIDQNYKQLARISQVLANTYRLTLIEKKKFNTDQADALRSRLEKEYLTRYFGKEPAIREFGLKLILKKKREAALELNKAVKTFGKNIDPQVLIYKISKEFLGERAAKEAQSRHSDEQNQQARVSDRAVVWCIVFFIGFCALVVIERYV